jgi:acyl-CoA thioester hydrolase
LILLTLFLNSGAGAIALGRVPQAPSVDAQPLRQARDFIRIRIVECFHPAVVVALFAEPGMIWMLDRTDLEPLFFAPFVSSVMRVEPAWIDYNGHLNMAYYNVLFDRCVDEAYELLGIGLNYLNTQKHSTFTAEAHVRYLREINEGDPVRVTFQMLDYDTKRVHYFQQLFHATEGWVSATSENMTLHVDMTAKKVVPFPDRIMRTLGQMRASHSRLPRPEAAGRRIEMPVKS